MTEDAELAAEYDQARGYNLPPADRPQVRAHLVGLTDEERDLLRDWWDEETTVGVESSFPIISRILTARREEYHALHLGVLAQAQREAKTEALMNAEGFVAVEAVRHTPDETGGCTCGFCAWSPQHVAVMAYRDGVRAALAHARAEASRP